MSGGQDRVPGGEGAFAPQYASPTDRAYFQGPWSTNRKVALAWVIDLAKSMATDCINTDDIAAAACLIDMVKSAAATIGALQSTGDGGEVATFYIPEVPVC